MTLARVRAVDEFGFVMIFVYFPQGILVKLYTNMQNDGVDAVYTLYLTVDAAVSNASHADGLFCSWQMPKSF
jgi:hypothetical protein